MAVVVSLREVVDEIEVLMNGCTAYINKRTGELYTLTPDDAYLLEDDDDFEDLPDWQQERIPVIREIRESGDWLELPTKFDIHEWAIMDEFTNSIDVTYLREELRDAIHGAGAFRHFQSTIRRHRIEESWYRYKTAAIERIAIDWLDEHEIGYTREAQRRTDRASKSGTSDAPTEAADL